MTARVGDATDPWTLPSPHGEQVHSTIKPSKEAADLTAEQEAHAKHWAHVEGMGDAHQVVGGEREWAGNARVYEWDGEDGEIGPEFPDLELELFGEPSRRGETLGVDFSK